MSRTTMKSKSVRPRLKILGLNQLISKPFRALPETKARGRVGKTKITLLFYFMKKPDYASNAKFI